MGKFAFSTVAVGVVVVVFLQVCGVQSAEQCIKGLYHKATPSPESNQFQTCHAWKNNSCCTAHFTADLMANQTRNLYNHSWHRCGNLSQKCEEFWVKQECFYQCSPFVYKWKDPDFEGGLKGVPMCSDVCDSWYDACKNDQICVENVLSHYNFSVHGENFCPNDKNCTSYAAMYGSGKGLCEKMWGGSYIYTEANADHTNCLMMDFNGTNPNGNVNPSAVTDAPTVGSKGFANTAEVFVMILSTIVITAFQ